MTPHGHGRLRDNPGSGSGASPNASSMGQAHCHRNGAAWRWEGDGDDRNNGNNRATHIRGEGEVSRPARSRCSIGAPLIMALGRALLVPLDDEDWDSVMTSVAANSGRSNTGWLLALAACGLLAVTAVRLRSETQVCREGAHGHARHHHDCDRLGELCRDQRLGRLPCRRGRRTRPSCPGSARSRTSTTLPPPASCFLMIIIAAIGYIVLAVGLARSSIVTKGAAVLIADRWRSNLADDGRPAHSASGARRVAARRRTRPGRPQRDLTSRRHLIVNERWHRQLAPVPPAVSLESPTWRDPR